MTTHDVDGREVPAVPNHPVATVAIASFLGLTAFFSVRYADNRLIDQVDRSLVNQAVFVRQQLQEHHILSATGPAGEFGQFFRADGTFIGSGTNIVGFPPLIHVTATGPNPRLFTVSNPRLGRLRILEEQFGSGSAPILVLGQQINQIAAARRVLTLLPTIGVPVVVLALAVIVWIVVGRAMSPVEAIRKAVAEVSDADPSERLPSPGTGDELERLVETMNVMLDRLHRAVEPSAPSSRMPVTNCAALSPGCAQPWRASTRPWTSSDKASAPPLAPCSGSRIWPISCSSFMLRGPPPSRGDSSISTNLCCPRSTSSKGRPISASTHQRCQAARWLPTRPT